MLLVVPAQWWAIWGTREVEWSYFRFVWFLALPSLLLVEAGLLVDQGADTHGFRDLFYERRVRFFSTFGLIGIVYALSPWILGVRPWFFIGPVHAFASAVLALAAAGLVFRSHQAHVIIAALTLGLAILTLAPGAIPAV
jgi:hypothetical protein